MQPHELAAMELAAAEREAAAEIRALRDHLAGCCPPEGQPPVTVMMILGRLASIEQVMAGQVAKLEEAGTVTLFDRTLADAAVPAKPQRSRGRHRGRGNLRAVPGDGQPRLFSAGTLAAATAATMRHAWKAVPHHAAAAVVAGTAATAAVGAAVLVPSSPLHPSFGSSGPAAPAPAATAYSATPIGYGPTPSPSGKKGGQGAAITGWQFTSPPPSMTGGTATAPSSQSQSPPGPGPSSQAMAPPQVQVQGALDLGAAGTATLTITASGDGGWLSWQASSDTAGVLLSDDHGVLKAGESVAVTVSVTAALQALAGPATVTVRTGDGQVVPVAVSWTVAPLPSPSPTDTGILPPA